jgi:hypothetical protein
MMTEVYTDGRGDGKMKNQYVAPSLKVLGSLGDLTLKGHKTKVRNEVPDGYFFEGITLTS